jgi:hypothetical protein
VKERRARNGRWQRAHREQANAWKRASVKRGVDGLSDRYIAMVMRLRRKDCPPALIEAKRAQLKLYRLATQE